MPAIEAVLKINISDIRKMIKEARAAQKEVKKSFDKIEKKSRDIEKQQKKTNTAIKKTGQAAKKAGKQAKKAGKDSADASKEATEETKKQGKEYSRLQKSVKSLTRSIKFFYTLYLGFRGISAFIRINQEAQELNNQLRTVTYSQIELNNSYSRLEEIASRTGSKLQDNVRLFTDIQRIAGEAGIDSEDSFGIIETLNKIAVIGGRSNQETSYAIRQLKQGLSSGFVQGDEFRSIRENLPLAARAVSDYLGVNFGDLKKLAKDNQLTTEVWVRALVEAGKTVDEQYNKIDRTLGQATNSFSSSLVTLSRDIDKAFGVAGFLTKTVDALAFSLTGFGKAIRVYGEDINKTYSKLRQFTGEGNLASAQQTGLSQTRVARNGGTIEYGSASSRLRSGDSELRRKVHHSGASYLDTTSAVREKEKVELEAEKARQAKLYREEQERIAIIDANINTNNKSKNRLLSGSSVSDEDLGSYGDYSYNQKGLNSLEERYIRIQESYNQEIELLKEKYKTEQGVTEEGEGQIADIKESQAKSAIKYQEQESEVKMAIKRQEWTESLDGISSLFKAFGQHSADAFRTYQALALASATIAGYDAINKAYTAPPFWPLNAASVIGVTAKTFANVYSIASQKAPSRRFGGSVSSGQVYEYGEGGAIENFISSSGKKYALPSEDGRIDPSSNNSNININIINNSPAEVNAEKNDNDILIYIDKIDEALSFKNQSGESEFANSLA